MNALDNAALRLHSFSGAFLFKESAVPKPPSRIRKIKNLAKEIEDAVSAYELVILRLFSIGMLIYELTRLARR
jgi:hypothetical protein